MEEENKEVKEVEKVIENNGEVALENNTNIKISDDVVSFYEGLARIKQDKKFGYIDSLGKIAIPIIYDDAKEFNFGKAEVQLNGETFYINRKGEALLNDSK